MPSAPHRRDLQHYYPATTRQQGKQARPWRDSLGQSPQPTSSKRPVPFATYQLLDVAIAGASLVVAAAATDLLPNATLPQILQLELSLATVVLLGAFLALWHASFAACELYEPRPAQKLRDDTQRLIAATLPATGALLCYLLLRHDAHIGHRQLVAVAGTFWVCACAGTFATRGALRMMPAVRSRAARKRILLVGSGPRAQRVWKIVAANLRAYHLIGVIDSDHRNVPAELRAFTLGSLDDLEPVLMRNVVDEVVIALPVKSKYAQIQRAIQTCEQMGIDVRYPADVFDWHASQAALDNATSLGSVSLRAVASDYRQKIKRPVELVVAAGAVVLLIPVLLLIAVAIKLQDGGPIFFVQMRHGLHRRVFPMLKFRTMVMGAEAMQAGLESCNEATGPVFKMRSDPRVTRVGALLRRASLDELPQLFNVLAGHMSIVGPRPLPRRDVGQFHDSWPVRRFSVRPGITGLWQVSGRSELSFDEHVALDLQYIDEWSLWLDVRIVLRTVGAVVRRHGAV